MQYPLYPLTASLAAGSWNLQAAIDFQADNGFEGIDDERALEDAIRLGWDGAGLDLLLGSWIGQKWAVMATICRNSSALGGLTEAQGRMMLARLDVRGKAGCPDLAVALNKAIFSTAVPEHVQIEIRKGAKDLLEEYRKL